MNGSGLHFYLIIFISWSTYFTEDLTDCLLGSQHVNLKYIKGNRFLTWFSLIYNVLTTYYFWRLFSLNLGKLIVLLPAFIHDNTLSHQRRTLLIITDMYFFIKNILRSWYAKYSHVIMMLARFLMDFCVDINYLFMLKGQWDTLVSGGGVIEVLNHWTMHWTTRGSYAVRGGEGGVGEDGNRLVWVLATSPPPPPAYVVFCCYTLRREWRVVWSWKFEYPFTKR